LHPRVTTGHSRVGKGEFIPLRSMSSLRSVHPKPLTEPYVTVSRHTALRTHATNSG